MAANLRPRRGRPGRQGTLGVGRERRGRMGRGCGPAGRGQRMADQQFASVEEYIGSFPAGVQPILEQVRRAILDAVPGAGETISYHIPTITLGGRPLLYFAGWKRHISLYPAPAGDEALERRLGPYRAAK